MRNIFRIAMVILCAVVAVILFRRQDMLFAVISAILAVLFLVRLVSDNSANKGN